MEYKDTEAGKQAIRDAEMGAFFNRVKKRLKVAERIVLVTGAGSAIVLLAEKILN